MGLNRIYTFGGNPLKSASGNPIGYEHLAYPTDGLVHRYNFSNSLEDITGDFDMTATGTVTYGTGPSGLTSVEMASGAYIENVTDDWSEIFNDTNGSSISFWFKGTNIGRMLAVGANSDTTSQSFNLTFGPTWSSVEPSNAWGAAYFNCSVYQDNNWHNLIMTYDKDSVSDCKIYIDNSVMISSTYTGGQYSLTADTFKLNDMIWDNNSINPASYAALSMYNKILSSEERTMLLAEGTV